MLELLRRYKLIAILRGVSRDQILPVAKALYDGGIRFIEVTFLQNSATCIEETTHAIREIVSAFPGFYVGAGTVMSVEQVEAAFAAGARFIVSPNSDPAVIKRTLSLGMISIPGAMTPSEIVDAHRAGAHFVKVFPAGVLGVDYIKAIREPISHIPLMAVGGVKMENMQAFYEAGVDGFAVGGGLVRKDLIEQEDYEGLEEVAKEYASQALGLRRE